MDPFPLTVLKALTDALGEIAIADGYQHDLAGKVFRGRLMFGSDDPLPMVAINEPPKAPENLEPPPSTAERVVNHELLLQGFAEDDRQNPTDPAYRLLADVQRRLAIERTRAEGYDILGLGPRITNLGIGKGVVRPPETTVSDTAFFWLPVTISYAEDLKNPFA